MLVGCTETINPDDAVARVNSNNLQRLSNLYLAYQSSNDWRGPADEKAFKDFISSSRSELLARIGVDPNQMDKLFLSERDEQPFKIRYAVSGNMMGSFEPVVFESHGVDGNRMVGFLSMEQREVETAEYDDLWAGKVPVAETVR